MITALTVFIAKWRRERGQARAQLQHLGIGLLVLSAGAITTNLLLPIATGRSTLSWLGPYFTLPFVALVGHAIIRHRLMDLRIFVSRSLAYGVAMAAASALSITAARLIFPGWDAQTYFVHPNIVTITIVALAMLSSPAQKFFNRAIDPYLYRGIEHAIALRAATRRLSRLMQPAELASELRQILAEVLVPESFTLLVRSFESDSFEQLSSNGSSQVDPQIWAALQLDYADSGGVLVVNPAEDAGVLKPIHDALRNLDVELVVMIGRRGQLLGLVLLGSPAKRRRILQK